MGFTKYIERECDSCGFTDRINDHGGCVGVDKHINGWSTIDIFTSEKGTSSYLLCPECFKKKND